MFVDLPQQLILYTASAFLAGWVLSAISSRLRENYRAKRRDQRDSRIRELEAELRIARGDNDRSKSEREQLEEQLKETNIGLERRDSVITEQQAQIEKIKRDLKDSVIKTRELRAELADRATENVHAEAKIREVETELSVVQASSDMLATGVLDYGLSPGQGDGESASADENPAANVSKSAT